MSDQQLDELRTGSMGRDFDRGAGRVSRAWTRSPGLAGQPSGGGLALDPLAGEDEPWADHEEFARFFRSLWLAMLLCLLFWLALALTGFALVNVTV
jgi:hypothetical protein